MANSAIRTDFVLCVGNEGLGGSLEIGKVYRRLPDAKASRHGMLRVVDESGEDYLFPRGLFVPIKLPSVAKRAILSAVNA